MSINSGSKKKDKLTIDPRNVILHNRRNFRPSTLGQRKTEVHRRRDWCYLWKCIMDGVGGLCSCFHWVSRRAERVWVEQVKLVRGYEMVIKRGQRGSVDG